MIATIEPVLSTHLSTLAMTFDTIELIGYLASGLVVLSLSMTSVVRLRIISLMGSTTFIVYGALIGSIPIMITNVSIACLNVWFLSRELGGKRDLGAVAVDPDSPFLVDFLRHHHDDIARFQPTFDIEQWHDINIVLTRDGLPAGAIIGNRQGPTLMIELDYVLKPYRDSRLGRWVYGPGSKIFKRAGIERVETLPGDDRHESYLRRIGFEYDAEHRRWFAELG